MIDRSLVRILFVALAVRLVHAAAILESPFVRSPIIDARTYLAWAEAVAAGRDPFAGEAYWQAPLYPYAAAGLFRLAGVRPAALLVAQSLVGAATAGLVYLAARRIVGGRAAPFAGWAAALYGPALFFEGEYLPATLATAFAAAGIFATTFPGAGAALLAGLTFGLGGLAFPFVFAGAPATALARRRAPAQALLVLAAAAAVAAPAVARNVLEAGSASVSANAAINLFLGNSPDDANVRARPGVRWDLLHEAVGCRPPPEGAGWLARAAEEIRARPGAFVGGLARKALQFWNGHERMRNTDPYQARAWSPILAALLWERGLSFPFGLVAPLALLGLPALARRPAGAAAAFYIAGVFLLSVAFFVTARYRLVAVPALLVAAAEGGGVLLDAWRRGRPSMLAAAGILFLVARAPIPGLRLNEPWTAPYHLALSASLRGERAEAAAHFEAARRLAPDEPDPWAGLGRIAAAEGRLDEADTLLRAALERAPASISLRVERGRILARAGRRDEARAVLEEAVRLCPGHPDARRALADLAGDG